MATSKKTSTDKDGAKAFERFLPEARALTRVIPLKADASLARQNVARGVEAIMRYELRIRRELPSVDVKALRSLPDLALATAYAASEVARTSLPREDLGETLARARELRELLLASAESLATAGVVREDELRRIRSGLGPLDSARDCVALAAIFRSNASVVKGKTPVSAAAVNEAERLGAELLDRLKPARPSRPPNPEAVTAAVRDKLWTLLVRRHEQLWRVGAYLLGREVDKHVPPLQARAAGKKKSAASA